MENNAFHLGTKNSTFYGFGHRNQFMFKPVVTADVVFVRGVPPTNKVRLIGASTIRGSVGLVTYTSTMGRSRDGGFEYANAWCASYSSAGGDSGGPVYDRLDGDRAVAYGMHLSSHFTDGKRDAGCFVHIDSIERAA